MKPSDPVERLKDTIGLGPTRAGECRLHFSLDGGQTWQPFLKGASREELTMKGAMFLFMGSSSD